VVSFISETQIVLIACVLSTNPPTTSPFTSPQLSTLWEACFLQLKYQPSITPGAFLAPPQAINLRKGSLSAGYSLLLKSGPHWLEVCPSALPITIYSSTGDGSGSRGETNKAPPLQVGAGLVDLSAQYALTA
jgi:hypothetical protein